MCTPTHGHLKVSACFYSSPTAQSSSSPAQSTSHQLMHNPLMYLPLCGQSYCSITNTCADVSSECACCVAVFYGLSATVCPKTLPRAVSFSLVW